VVQNPWLLMGNIGIQPDLDFLGTTDDQPLVIKTASSERIRIDPTGNVGIGNPNPAHPLHLAVGKALRIEGGTGPADTAAYFSFGENGSFSIDAPGVPAGRFVVENSGHVGIGNPSPATALHVSGDLTVSPAGGAQGRIVLGAGPEGTSVISSQIVPPPLPLPDETSGSDLVFSTFPIEFRLGIGGHPPPSLVPVERMRVDHAGNVGVGTPSPVATLDVRGQGAFQGPLAVNNRAAVGSGLGEPPTDDRAAITFGATDTSSAYYFGAYTSDTRNNTAFGLYSYATQKWLQIWEPSGQVTFLNRVDVGIGQGGPDPTSLLQVGGALTVVGLIKAEGDVTVGGDVLLSGADCAEQFDVSADAELPEPGTVVVLGDDGGLAVSQEAYDRKVAGVVSGAGDYKHAIVLDKRPGPADGRVAVALAGKVYCNIDAGYAPIAVGDLLTTSPTPGHAMKATDPSRAHGSIIGKALQALDGDRALIPILVALQ
jgi:hypothetical protein